jgi:hypothetical protein
MKRKYSQLRDILSFVCCPIEIKPKSIIWYSSRSKKRQLKRHDTHTLCGTFRIIQIFIEIETFFFGLADIKLTKRIQIATIEIVITITIIGIEFVRI